MEDIEARVRGKKPILLGGCGIIQCNYNYAAVERIGISNLQRCGSMQVPSCPLHPNTESHPYEHHRV